MHVSISVVHDSIVIAIMLLHIVWHSLCISFKARAVTGEDILYVQVCECIFPNSLSCCVQKFAEKPKGKELDAMKVDTTVLGKSETCQACTCVIALQT